MGVNDGTDGAEWDVEPEDDSGAVIAAVGRQIRLWREAAGLRASELGEAIGYGENLVYKVEAGTRIPKPEFLDRTDEAVGAGGKIAAMKRDVAEARYPKKVRDLAKLEAEAVELGAYDNHNLNGLLQTEEYARALYEMRRPSFGPDEINRYVAARMARQEVLERQPLTMLTFVQEEATIRRPLGGAGGHAASAGTALGDRPVAERRNSGDADGPGGPCWDGRSVPPAEVR